MKKLVSILGLLGVLLVVADFVLVAVLRFDLLLGGFVLAPLLVLLLPVFALSVLIVVVALAALAYGDTRPKLSACLYIVATAAGSPLLLLLGLTAVHEPKNLSFLFVLPLVAWLAAGVLAARECRA